VTGLGRLRGNCCGCVENFVDLHIQPLVWTFIASVVFLSVSPEQKELVRHHHKEWTRTAKDSDAGEVQAPAPSVLDDKFTSCATCDGKGTVPFKDSEGEGFEPCPTCAKAK
jgi:hypothetical protein